MKTKVFSVLAVALLAACSFGEPIMNTGSVNFSWTGDNGYSITGLMSYSSFSNTIEYGYQKANTGIVDFTANYYDPSNNLISTYSNVASGTVNYYMFTITYNIAEQTFGMGTDIYLVSSGRYGLHALSTDTYLSIKDYAMGGSLVDSSTSPLTVVPEPMTMALLGLGGLMIRRRRA